MLKTRNETIILERPFLATIHAEIDVFNKEVPLEIGDNWVNFDMNKKLNNFTTPVGTIYMINNEPSSSNDTPTDESSRVENYLDGDRKIIRGSGLSFPEFLLVSFIYVAKELMDALSLGRENESRFSEMIRKEVDSGRKVQRKTGNEVAQLTVSKNSILIRSEEQRSWESFV
ncbi:hypothetical protein Tco_0710115 [Tanacetum coccineum]